MFGWASLLSSPWFDRWPFGSPFYTLVRQLVIDSHFRFNCQCQIVVYFVEFARFAAIGVLRIRYPNQFVSYCEVDPLAHFLAHSFMFRRSVSSLLACSLLLLAIVFGMAMHYFLFFSPLDTLNWRVIYEVTVHNTDLYQDALRYHLNSKLWRIQYLFAHCCYQKIRYGRSVVDTLRVAIKLEQVAQSRLQYEGAHHVDLQQRLHVLFMLALSENIVIFTNCAAALVIMLSAYKYLEHFLMVGWMSMNHLWRVIQALASLTFEISVFIVYVRSSLTVFPISTVLESLVISQLRKQYHSIRRLVHRSGRLHYRLERVQLYHLIEEHITLSHYVLHINRDLWSKVIYVGLVTMFPINILLTYYVLFIEKSAIEQFISWTVLFFQITLLTLIMTPMMWLNAWFLASRPCWPRILTALIETPNPQFRLYIKAAHFYERLNHPNNQYGMSIGRGSTITKNKLFEV